MSATFGALGRHSRSVREQSPPGDEARLERDDFACELREAAASIRRHGLAVAATAGLALLVGLGAAALRPPAYVSAAQILLDPRGLKVIENEVVPPAASADVNDAIIDTQIRLLNSDGVYRQVTEHLGLQRDPDYAPTPGLLRRLKEWLTGPSASGSADPVGIAATILGQRVTSQRQGKSFVVTTTARAGDPASAARIATDVVAVFLADVERRRRDTIVGARDAMAATLNGQRRRLADAEDSVERYKAQQGIVDVDGRSVNTARLTELNSQLLLARSASQALASRLGQLERPGGTPPGSDSVESPLLNQLKGSRAEVMRQAENLRATLGTRHPQVIEIDAQSRSLDRAIAAETARIVAALRADGRAASIREAALAADVARLEAETTRRSAALVTLRQLEREAVAQRSVYERFLERERELREQESIAATNASVVAEASVPSEPIGLRPGLLGAAAFALGAILGAFGAVLTDRIRGRVYSAERLAARTGLDVVGSLPLARPRSSAGCAIPCLIGRGAASASSRLLYSVADGLDAVSGQAPFRVMILSSGDSSARTVVSVNLALAGAQRGRTVLLVDGDPETGRLGWMNGQSEAGPTVVTCVPEGFPPFHATALDESPDLRLEPPAHAFDRVLVDASGSMDELDLRDQADLASAIVLVAESGRTILAEIEGLKTSLSRNAGKVLGILWVVPGRDVALPIAARVLHLPLRPQLAGRPRLRASAA